MPNIFLKISYYYPTISSTTTRIAKIVTNNPDVIYFEQYKLYEVRDSQKSKTIDLDPDDILSKIREWD